ncbi:hypothetical protein VTP01DRAFT_9831 [Rhizomucor pusillus]|uniref:uncharacterized protein n=1 Tax=Rhizomucor pusillus TaxID=4840 RepID=UPI003744789C
MSGSSEIQNVIQVLQQQIEQAQNDNLTLRGKLDECNEQQRELSTDNQYLRKKVAALQLENSNYGNTQARLETQLYAQEQDIASLRKEIQQLTKAKKDADKKLTLELQNFESDRMRWQQREADLYNQVRSLSVAQGEPRTPRTPRRRSVTATTMNGTTMSPFTTYPLNDIDENGATTNGAISNSADSITLGKETAPKLAAIDSSYAREAKIAQRTIKAQDKLISDLKAEIEKQKSVIQDQQTQIQQQSLRVEHLELEIANVKQVNRSLMEDNESYQILLHEKTISGEFMMNPIMQVDQDNNSPENTLKELKRRSLKQSSSTTSSNNGLNLAAELNLASVGTADWELSQKASEMDKTVLKLSEENKMLQDTNRALQLYMNKILMKIINNKQLEDVLSIDQPKPAKTQPDLSNQSSSQQQRKSTPPAPGPGPAPTRTLSSTLLGKSSSNRQRRRTISYWNGGGNKDTVTDQSENLKISATDRNVRRHSSIAAKDPERPQSSTSTSNSGWAKALRRMSGIGWSAAKAIPDDLSKDDNSNDSVHSKSSAESPKLAAPSMSRSTSTTSSSLRRSNELGTLQEE